MIHVYQAISPGLVETGFPNEMRGENFMKQLYKNIEVSETNTTK